MKVNKDGQLVEEGLVELSFTIPTSYIEAAIEDLVICRDDKIEADYIEFSDLIKLCMNKDGSIIEELLKIKVWVGRYFETNK